MLEVELAAALRDQIIELRGKGRAASFHPRTARPCTPFSP